MKNTGYDVFNRFLTKTVYAFLAFSIRATYSAHLKLVDFTVLTTQG